MLAYFIEKALSTAATEDWIDLGVIANPAVIIKALRTGRLDGVSKSEPFLTLVLRETALPQ